jgi:hypothetical protein
MGSPVVPSPLATTWNHYREWALTARDLKSHLDRWRLWTLILAVSGSVLVTIGQQLGSIPTMVGPWTVTIGKIVGLGGAAAIALSTYFAREALSNENVQLWTKCRSAAESLKACTYLYRASVPPFDGTDRDQKIIDRRSAIEESAGNVERLVNQADDSTLVSSSLSGDEYYQQRVKDQIQFYRERSDEYQKKTAALRNIVFWLGTLAVLLGVASAIQPLVAGWTAVIATIIASVASHIQSQRYQSLIATYQATARRLETLGDKWVASGRSDADRNTFIQSCEDTMALENNAWVTQWSQLKAPGK